MDKPEYVISTVTGELVFDRVAHSIQTDEHNNLVVTSILTKKRVTVINANSWITIKTQVTID